MGKVDTKRYKITYEELSKGGPAGYESVYLISEGDPAPEELYDLLSSMKGHILAAENKNIRQRNGAELIEALKKRKKIGIASGFKPSGPYHFGHKLTSSAVSFFQKNGAQIFMPVADLECMLDTKMSKEDYMFWAADNLIDWGANGVDLDAAHVYLQSEEHRVSNLAYLMARGLEFDLTIDTYSFEKMFKEFPFLFAGITQVGDIVLPQHQDFGNYHSFMVSGQDQDGHMKMTVELARKALESKIELPGVQTVPSGFYIPHIRGIVGKASSSKPENTLYIGSGPKGQDLSERTKTCLEKIDCALKDVSLRDNVRKGALDMVRYIDVFNRKSKLDFGKSLARMSNYMKQHIDTVDEETKSQFIDEYLMKECGKIGQDNVQLVRDLLLEVLAKHQRRRKEVFKYALERADLKDEGGWSDSPLPSMPSFWKVPKRAVVDESKRNRTQWYHIVAAARDRIKL